MLGNVKSPYIFKIIFGYISKEKRLKIIKINKGIQKRLKEDYKLYVFLKVFISKNNLTNEDIDIKELELKNKDIRNEEEKEKQREKIKVLMENGEFVQNQMKEREEKDRSSWKEKYEEGRKIKQLSDAYYNSIEMIKQQKIAELRALNIKDKYILPVEKYNPYKSFKGGK